MGLAVEIRGLVVEPIGFVVATIVGSTIDVKIDAVAAPHPSGAWALAVAKADTGPQMTTLIE